MSVNGEMLLINGGLSTKAIKRTRFEMARMPDELLARLLMDANVLHIPTNAAWVPSHAGGGGSALAPSQNYVRTSTTASSRGLLFAGAVGFAQEAAGRDRVNWGKKLYLVFGYCRRSSDSEAVARFQLKEAATEGALAAKGIGIRADNLALVGESYGSELGGVDLGVTLTDNYEKLVVIIHDPGTPKIEWYINGVLKGTQSTAARIPSGTAGAANSLVHSIINGLTGGVDVYSDLFHPKIWQAR